MYCAVIGASSMLVHHVRDRVAALVAEVGGREALERHVRGLVVDDGELLHRVAGRVRPERDLAPHPLGALLRDRALGELVAQPDLELGAVEARLAARPSRDEELPPLLAELVGGLVGHERRRGEDELQLLDLLELLAQRLEGEDRERRRGDAHLGARRDLGLEIVAEQRR